MTGRLKQHAIDFMLRQHQALVVEQLTADITQAIRDSSKRPDSHFHDCSCEPCWRHGYAQSVLAAVSLAAVRHGGDQVAGEHCEDELCEGCRAYEEAVRDAVARKIRGSW
jgi:hypothetical protein